MNSPFIKMAVMVIIEEDLLIYLVCSTHCIEMYHCLYLSIPVYISIWCIVDYPVFSNFLLKILDVVF